MKIVYNIFDFHGMIGPAIVKGIVERHGGRITLSSTEGRGTTFFLDFPLAQSAPTLVA